MRSLLVALAAGMIAAPAVASTFTMDIVDFLVDGRGLVGQLVTVTGCKFGQAEAEMIMCSNRAGRVRVDTDEMPREDVRRAIRECADFAPMTPATCAGAVSGLVVRDAAGLRITKAAIGWRPSN